LRKAFTLTGSESGANFAKNSMANWHFSGVGQTNRGLLLGRLKSLLADWVVKKSEVYGKKNGERFD